MAVGALGKFVLIEQACSLLLTSLFQLVNKLLQQWWLDNVVTTLLHVCSIVVRETSEQLTTQPCCKSTEKKTFVFASKIEIIDSTKQIWCS